MDESDKFERLANSLLDVIDEIGRAKVPPGMIGFAGELFTLSRLYYVLQEMKSKIIYLGGRKPSDIEVGGKKIFVKTNLYGNNEKQTFGVDEGFFWSDLRVQKIFGKKGKLISNEICFDFVVLVGIRDRQPTFYVLTKNEFMTASYDRGLKRQKGTRVIALIEKIDEKKYNTLANSEKKFVDHFLDKDRVVLIERSEGAWEKIRTSLYK